MKKIVSALLMAGVLSISLLGQSGLKREEYAAYATVLRDLNNGGDGFNKHTKKYSFVILQNTFQAGDSTPFGVRKYRAITKDFKRKNLRSSLLTKSFPTRYKYELISQSEIDELLKIGKVELERIEAEAKLRKVGLGGGRSEIIWKSFYAKYPDAAGYYRFSEIGFSPDRRVALVQIEGVGAQWNSNMTYILKKIRGKWEVYTAGGGFGIA
jgi:hypothetical protein